MVRPMIRTIPGRRTRVGIYARYSSDQQREASIEDQVRTCRSRAAREGWEVVEVFTDYARSGATALRPGHQAALAAVRTGVGGGTLVMQGAGESFAITYLDKANSSLPRAWFR
jgi:hypothetical protein